MDYAEPRSWRRSSRKWLLGLAVALTFGTAGALDSCTRSADAAGGRSLATLAGIVGDHRLTRARLSGGFGYAPCTIDSAASRLVRGLICDPSPPTAWSSAGELRAFATEIRNGSRFDAHTAGVWNLVWGKPDDAVADLTEAVRRNPADARALNDLAVALSEAAQTHDEPTRLVDAFVAADSAVRLDSSLHEARFTLAVLLEQLYLRTSALAAWKRYLQLDSTSKWAKEASARIEFLERPLDGGIPARIRLEKAMSKSDTAAVRLLVATYPSDTRALIQARLATWGDAVRSGDSASARDALNAARTLAGPLRTATYDSFMADAVAAIDRSIANGDRSRIRSLSEGHALLQSGIRMINSGDFGRADAPLVEARRLLARGRSPMALQASLYRAKARFAKNELDAALGELRTIRDSARAGYRSLRSSAAQTAGLIYDTRADYVHVVAAYDSAVAEGRATGDPEIEIRVRSWLAPKAAILRGRESGWRILYAALAATSRFSGNALTLHSVFSSAALATGDEAPRLSLRYSDEAIRAARTLPNPEVIATAFRLRAQQLANMKETALASAAVDSAFAAARLVSDSAIRTTLVSDATLARGLVAMRAAPAQAENALRDVIHEYRASDYGRGIMSAYLYLAQSRIASGNVDGARAAFDSAMSVMERQRATISDFGERAEFVDNARSTIDQIVAFHADHGDSAGAFEFFEHMRSRVLLEQVASGGRARIESEQTHTLPELRRLLPAGTVVMSYAVLPHETLIWVVGRDRFSMHRVAIASADLELLVTRLRESIADAPDDASAQAMLQRLDQLLIAPTGDIPRNARLVLIPDKWLHFVPFAALRDAKSDRFLVQDHAVSYSPSSSLLLGTLTLRGERRISKETSRVLAVGNPAFDPSIFALPRLPASEREARETAAEYTKSSTLVGPAATDVTLGAMVSGFDVLHFAGHAVVRTDAPEMSHLVLASRGGSGGAVFASDIARWHLRRMQLVILSGCSTSGGRLSSTEGPSSLARAFFAAGVPGVIASLWALEDEQTADFFVAFHQRLAGGEPAEAALRETQLAWIERSAPVSAWAGFQMFGS